MLEAKTHLSRLVEAVESGAETEVIIARNGKPAAKLVAIGTRKKPPLLGIAKGQFDFDKVAFDALDDEVAKLFFGEESDPS